MFTIDNFIWNDPLLRGHYDLSYEDIFFFFPKAWIGYRGEPEKGPFYTVKSVYNGYRGEPEKGSFYQGRLPDWIKITGTMDWMYTMRFVVHIVYIIQIFLHRHNAESSKKAACKYYIYIYIYVIYLRIIIKQ
jgi:hypothetical protein